MQSNNSNPNSPSMQIQKEDPFSFDFYLNQSPEQKQEQSTLSYHHSLPPTTHCFPHQEQHNHHSSPASSGNLSLSPIEDGQSSMDINSNSNSNSQHHYNQHQPSQDSYSSLGGSVALSRSSSAHTFGSNSLGLQGGDVNLGFNNGDEGEDRSFSHGGVKMTHSDSAPNFSFINPQHELDRRDSYFSSCSSPSTSSAISLANSYSSSYQANSLNQHFRRAANSSNHGGGSVSPASYISNPALSLPSPCPSPLGLPLGLSSIAGLAIIDGGNGNTRASDSSCSSSASSPHINPRHHQQLMALSSNGESNQSQMGMPLELNLMEGSNGHGGTWNERWSSVDQWSASQRSTQPTLGNALGLDSEDMDEDDQEEQEQEIQDGHCSKRRAPPGANDLEEALPSSIRSNAAGSSPAPRPSRPLGAILKRRATSSNVNDITPVALSRPSFSGPSSAASDLARHRHSVSHTACSNASSQQAALPPHTPSRHCLSNSLNSAIGMTPGMCTPASSHSVTATPDYSTVSLSTPFSAMKRSSSYGMGSSYTSQSDFESPVTSMMPPRYQRSNGAGLGLGMSKSQDLSGESPVGLPAHLHFGRNLERAMDGDDATFEEHGLGIEGNGMEPLSPFHSPTSKAEMTTDYSQDPPHSAGLYPPTSYGVSQLGSPAKMQRSQSLGMGAPYAPSTTSYTSRSSGPGSEGVSFSPAPAPRGVQTSGQRFGFSYGSSVPSTPNAPASQLQAIAYYTAPTGASSGMKLTMSRPTNTRRRNGPPPLVVSSTSKAHACHCGKRFRRAEHLKRHERAHTDEKPHVCPMFECGKAFGRSDNLAQHLKTHFKHLVLEKDELRQLMDGAKAFGATGAPCAMASLMAQKERLASLHAPPISAKNKRMSKKRTQEQANLKESSKISTPQNQTAPLWSVGSPTRQALSPTHSSTSNSPIQDSYPSVPGLMI